MGIIPGQAVVVRGINGTDVLVYTDGKVAISGDVNLVTGDIEIGAVELKDGTSENRAEINVNRALKISGDIVDITGTVSLPTGASTESTLSNILNRISGDTPIGAVEIIDSGGTNRAAVYAGGAVRVSGDVNLVNADIEIGAVELKDSVSDNRVEINTNNALKISGDIVNVTGTISLPTNASTETTLSNLLNRISGDTAIGAVELIDKDGTNRAVINTDGSVKISGDVNLVNADIQIGAVELKDGTSDNRTEINANRALKISGDIVNITGTVSLPTGASTEATLGNILNRISGDTAIGAVELIDSGGTNRAMIYAGGALRISGDVNVSSVTITDVNIPSQSTDLAVTLASEKVVIESGDININDGGNIITVDGTVTANAGTNLNTSALNLQTTQVGISGDINNIKTAVEIIDNAISGNEMLIAGGATQSSDVKVTLDSEKVVISSGDIRANVYNTVTIDGTVTANAGTNLNTSALNLQATQVGISGDVNDIRTSVQLIDNAISGNEILIAGGATQSSDVKITLDSEKVVIESGDTRTRIWDGDTDAVINADGSIKISGDVNLATGDIQIGAVELKDGVSDNRVEINANRALKVSGDLTITGSATEATLSNILNRISGDTAIGGVELIDSAGTNRATIYADGALRISGDVNTTVSGVTITDVNIPAQSTDLAVTLASEKIVIESGDIRVSDGGNTITVDGTVNIGTMPSVTISAVNVPIDISGDVTVSATDLDVRDLTSASDSVEVKQATATNLKAQINIDTTDAVATQLSGDTAAIKTSVQILDDWDESDRAKTNPIVGQAGVIAGEGVTGVTTQRVTLATDGGVVTQISGDTAKIVTAVQLIDNSVDGNYLNTNLNISGTDVSANLGALTAQTQRITLATDDPIGTKLSGDIASIDSKITACDTGSIAGTVTADAGTNLNTSALALETTLKGISGDIVTLKNEDFTHEVTQVAISGDINDIRTSVQLIDNAISGSEILIAGGATQSADVKITLDSEKIVIVSGDSRARIWNGINDVKVGLHTSGDYGLEVIPMFVHPLHDSQINPSYTLTRNASQQVTKVAMFVNGTTYTQDFTRDTSGDVIGIGAWY